MKHSLGLEGMKKKNITDKFFDKLKYQIPIDEKIDRKERTLLTPLFLAPLEIQVLESNRREIGEKKGKSSRILNEDPLT